MECRDASERLPWLLNGALGDEERRGVEAHLEGCPACRQELAETRSAVRLFDAHPGTQALVALAWGDLADPAEASLLQRHVEGCSDCAEELALTRASRALESHVSGQATPRPAPPAWHRPLGLAAGLLVGLGLGLGLGVQRGRRAVDAAQAERQAMDRRLEGLEGDLRGLRVEAERARRLDARLAELAHPQPNLPVVELLPSDTVVRGASDQLPRLAGGGDFVALALVFSGAPGVEEFAVELRGADGAALWRTGGLRRQGVGELTLLVPRPSLPAGRADLRLFGRRGNSWQPVARYGMIVPPSPPPSTGR